MKQYGFLMLGVVIALVGCTTMNKKVLPGSERVAIVDQIPSKGCYRINKVNASDNNGFTQSYTSHEHLQTDQIISLKNQAAELGANVILLTEHEATYRKWTGYSKIDTHAMAGIAYRCNEAGLERLRPLSMSEISDVRGDE